MLKLKSDFRLFKVSKMRAGSELARNLRHSCSGPKNRRQLTLTPLLLLLLLMVQVSIAVVETMASHARRLFVLVQVAAQRERFTAPTAHVRLVGRVRLDVSAQVRLVSERLAAVWTAERFLAGMRADVALEQPRSGESLAALWTLATLTVRPHVHAVGRRRRVDLVAVRTFTRRGGGGGGVRRHTTTLVMVMLTDVGGPMALAMSGQVAGGAVRPSALGARVERRRRRRRRRRRHVDGRSDGPSR